jgi:uncharacterized protein YbbC (DUF1343 family)
MVSEEMQMQGEKVKNGVDVKTGIPIVSLYGKNKKPLRNN